MAMMRARRLALGLVLLAVLGTGACGGGGGGGTGEPEPPTTITVSGAVLTQLAPGSAQRPDAGASVVIVGHPEVVTDVAGRFAVSDVSTPYDVLVLDDAGASVVVYLGLTRSDPVLQGAPPAAAALHSTWAMGDITGGVGWPPPAGHQTIFSYGNPERGSSGHNFPRESDGYYEYALTWTGENTIPVGGAALQWQQGGGVPVAYTGFGAVTRNATDGVLLSGLDIPLAPVDAQAVTGTVAVQPGYGMAPVGLTARLDSGAQLAVGFGSHTDGPFSALVPDLPEATLWMSLAATTPWGASAIFWRTVQPGDTGVSLTMPEAVQQLAPPDDAVGVTHETLFEVTAQSDCAIRVRYAPVFPSDGPIVFVTTGNSTWTVPDLSLYGVFIPPASEYAWEVTGYGPATVDDLCAPTPITSRSPHYETRTSFFSFTTGS